jgi:hypothetical protein
MRAQSIIILREMLPPLQRDRRRNQKPRTGQSNPARPARKPREFNALEFFDPTGIARLTGLDLADQKRPRFSYSELTPLSQGDEEVLLEDIAVVEVAIL